MTNLRRAVKPTAPQSLAEEMRLRDEIEASIGELSQTQHNKYPNLNDHKNLLKEQLKNTQLSTRELQEIFNRHENWKKIILNPNPPKPFWDPRATTTPERFDVYQYQFDHKNETLSDTNLFRKNASDHIARWEIIISNMPDIEEKVMLEKKLNDLKGMLTPTMIPSNVYNDIKSFDGLALNYEPLLLFLHKNHKNLLKDNKQQRAEPLKQEISEIPIEKKEEIENIGKIGKISSDGFTTNIKKTRKNFPSEIFKSEKTSTEELKILEKTPYQNDLIKQVRAKQQEVKNKKDKYLGKRKEIPSYVTHKFNVLGATLAYLEAKTKSEREQAYEALGKALQSNTEYDRVRFSHRHETKNLVILACNLFSDPFPDPKKIAENKKAQFSSSTQLGEELKTMRRRATK